MLHCNFKKSKQRRPSIASQLLDIIQVATANRIASSNLEIFMAKAKELLDLFSNLETLSKPDALSPSGSKIIISIVRIANDMSHQNIEESLLYPAKLDKNKVRLIFATIKKLGRYVSSCSYLIRASRQYGCFSSTRVNIIKLLPPQRLSYAESQSIVDNLSNRFANLGGKTKIISCLQPSKGPCNAKELVEREKDLRQLATLDCAVHAEIQLLFHYLMVKPSILPRVICSTKKACYLCCLFFELDDRFFVPSTHGRLYEKWALPDFPRRASASEQQRLFSTISKFSGAIEGKISHILTFGTKPYPQPMESTIFRSAIWSAHSQSRLEYTPALSETRQIVEASTGVQKNTVDDAVQPPSSEVLVQETKSRDDDHGNQVSPADVEESYAAALPTTDFEHSDNHDFDGLYRLELGKPISLELLTCQPPVRIETKRIHLTLTIQLFDRSAPVAQPGLANSDADQRLIIMLKWLESVEQDQAIRENLNLVDIEALAYNSEAILDQYVGPRLTGLYLCHKTDMILIRSWKE